MATAVLARPAALSEPAVPEPIPPGLDDPGTYPVLSEAAVRAMSMVNGGQVSINQLAAVIRPDAFLTAAVIHTANSARFGGRATVDTVPAAVLRIGLRECGKLVSALGMESLFLRLGPAARRGCEELHRHSVFVACLAGGLNRMFGMEQGQAFTAGLLHDVGRVILCGKAPLRYRLAELLQPGEGAPQLARERAAFGTDHLDVGERFATRYGLPAPVVRAIRSHHRPAAGGPDSQLVGLVATAEVIANHAQRVRRLSTLDLAAEPGFAALAAGWSPARLKGFREQLPQTVKDAIREARGMLRAHAAPPESGVR